MPQFYKKFHLFYVLCTLALLISLPQQVHSQITAPEMAFETYGIISSSGTTPFWLQSNRHGMFGPGGSQVLTRVQAHGTGELFGPVRMRYGADFIARPGVNSTASFNQGYVSLDAWGVYLQAGRFHNTSPIHDAELGMGSLGVSNNATPIPQIRTGLVDWTSLPFTRDFIQIKGHIAHGWLGSSRYVDNVLYHEKVGHARFGGDFPLNLYGGIAHYAKWGGQNNPQFGDLPSSFSDFFRVFMVVGGDEEAPPGEAGYMLGDHLGAWDFGFKLEMESFDLKFYRQHPLETKDNLKLKSLQDALNGISIQFHENLGIPIKGISYEFMYTKWQDGPRIENIIDGVPCSDLPTGTCRDMNKGNENYYNHYIYRTGWVTHGRIIGNPLFRRSNLTHDELVPGFGGRGIDNNRIIAHHLGLTLSTGNYIVIANITGSKNYGTWNEPFPSPKDQFSLGIQTFIPITLFNQSINLRTEFAWDSGDLFGNQFGAGFGLHWLIL